MWVIHIQARCPSALSELLGASERDAALAVESIVSVALLELCGEVTMDRVWITTEAADTPIRTRVGSRAPDGNA